MWCVLFCFVVSPHFGCICHISFGIDGKVSRGGLRTSVIGYSWKLSDRFVVMLCFGVMPMSYSVNPEPSLSPVSVRRIFKPNSAILLINYGSLSMSSLQAKKPCRGPSPGFQMHDPATHHLTKAHHGRCDGVLGLCPDLLFNLSRRQIGSNH